MEQTDTPIKGSSEALWLSSLAFTVCFAVWTIFSIIGIAIQKKLGLSQSELGLLIATPVLTGSLVRIPLGIWTEQIGGRIIFVLSMLASALSTFLLTFAHTYTWMLIAALGIGIAGGTFSVGVAYVSRWFSAKRQGLALGIFGAGNVGAAVTKLGAPWVMSWWGSWEGVAYIWALVLVITAVIFWLFTSDDPVLVEQRRSGRKPQSALLELAPLKKLQVWRFSFYYFFVFGGYIALATWLPHYLQDVYSIDLWLAGVIAALYSIPASLFRAYGGYLSDKYGARRVMYWTLTMCTITCFILSYPPTQYTVETAKGPFTFTFAISLVGFAIVVAILGFFMALGKAAVYKHIPVYYPKSVGAVGGLVGMMGGLGGFILPILFGEVLDITGIYSTCFMILFVISLAALIWMHVSILMMNHRKLVELGQKTPEFQE
ncbi:NarK/NasA family nitrate transporter [Bartonella sp. M0176]|nr:NarK/NasA family nitrate transporter [Bartonella sp. P0291]MBH9996502.1 NarK/NasA family nitrate transporter [Bartonella sp. M0192]MBH9998663.1 NarK/NasA family nitrate transporter [Bartonella sp. M0191]MBI0008229.1 NarK/NasA family nitrate transporter [Bartonella sp. M0193]MBI0009953.1 NarK/NasA family nitrate transporter [Bartonella sp. M0176]MBI0012926.1 NarK/NasA family nitrate transporter [Bartonella apihabitans]